MWLDEVHSEGSDLTRFGAAGLENKPTNRFKK